MTNKTTMGVLASSSSLDSASELVNLVRDPEPPCLDLDKVHAIARDLYGVTGEFKELRSERDQIFKVTTGAGHQFVLRISGPGETPAILDFQNLALSKIASSAPQLPVPRVCKSAYGRMLEHVDEPGRIYGVRLFTFIPGERIQGRRPSLELYRDIGQFLASLDKALSGLRNPPADQLVLWNMNQAANLRSLIGHVEDRTQRQLLETVFDRLDAHALKKLTELRSQVIHNDFTPKNVLIEINSPNYVSGVIDFGDLVESTLIVDLGVAIARQIHLADALDAACEIVSGYHANLPLEESEVAILFDVMCARLAMRATIWSWRKSLRDPRFHPGQIGDTFDRLTLLLKHGENEVTDRFRAVCRGARLDGTRQT